MPKDKREAFLRVAETRTQKIIEMLRLLGNCSNRNNYEYSEDDVEQMFSAIDKALKSVRDSYSQELNKQNNKRFTFSNK